MNEITENGGTNQAETGTEGQPSALVIVGPSGVGKGTLINKLMEGDTRFGFSISHTTRLPRPGEQDGVHYHFTTRESFESDISQSKFLEYAHVHKNIYGTSIKAVQDVATSGKCCVLDIDVQGARQVRAAPRLPAIFVFVAPPNQEELEKRLRGRGTDSEEQVITRLDSARVEMESAENEPALYDYVIVNDSLERAVGELRLVAEAALRGEVGRTIEIGRKIGNNSNGGSGAETTGHPPPPAAAAAAAAATATVLA